MRLIRYIYACIGIFVILFTFQGFVTILRYPKLVHQSKDAVEIYRRQDGKSKISTQNDSYTIRKKPIYPEDCSTIGLHSSHKENLDKIRNYTFPGAQPYLSKLFSRSSHPPTGRVRILPVMVTAVSSSHVTEVMLLLDNINHVVRKRYPDIKLYLYDIGLTNDDIIKIKSKCRCAVIPFRFEDYPPHVKLLKGYAWKPIIVQLVAQEHPFIFWLDTSIRFKESKLEDLFTKAKQLGVLAAKGYNPVTSRVHRETFAALNEDPCIFSKPTQMQACFMILFINDFILNFFLKPWVGCALSLGCTVPKGDPFNYLECNDKVRKDMFHMCHRFDQSVMNILLYRMFGEHYHDHVMKFKLYEIDRLNSNLV